MVCEDALIHNCQTWADVNFEHCQCPRVNCFENTYISVEHVIKEYGGITN